jgi:hypothetical protein
MVNRLVTGIGLADGRHGNCGQYARINPLALQDALHGERVHDRCQDAHVIGADPIHALGGARHAPEDVAAADDQSDLRTGFQAANDIVGDTADGREVDAELTTTHQRLARHLEEDALVGEFLHREILRHG